jgi:hypothetical protein
MATTAAEMRNISATALTESPALLGAEGLFRHLFFRAVHGDVLPPERHEDCALSIDEIDECTIGAVLDADGARDDYLPTDVSQVGDVHEGLRFKDRAQRLLKVCYRLSAYIEAELCSLYISKRNQIKIHWPGSDG